ncbi:lysophospholipase [Mycolicibacter sinensis]|uniref:Lysophospholipase n=1 Tax=Mycolicibacter sinensis (strain JDM601) TaxID=875328 RepID=F5YRQ0_MYCSD|nr:alpha/beta hydrolase [Mycolicibacter sinensis]AEF37841.1 lysophospholipase [Mycolicibacter sinensis]
MTQPLPDTETWRFADKQLEIIRGGPEDASVPILLVHGVCHGAWCWQRYIRIFAERGHHVIALSLRGHGASSGGDRLHRFGLDDYVDDVADVLGAVGRRAVLVGHSMGGAIVQRYLATRSPAVRAAVLFASATAGGLGGRRFIDVIRGIGPTAMINALRFVSGRGGTADQANNTPFFSGRLSAADAHAHAERLGPESLRAVCDLLRRGFSVPQELPPMLVIGSRDDALFGARSQRITAQTYGVREMLLDGLCHDMMLDPHWRTPAEHILEFIAALD